MEQIRSLYRLLTTITCLVCVGFNLGICSESDASVIKTYASSSLPSNDDLVYSSKLKVNKISESEWDSLVIKSEVPVMVMFTQDGCPPCQYMRHVMDELDSKYTGRFKFYTLNVHEETGIAIRYDIFNVPTTIVFKGGDEMARVYGSNAMEVRRLVEQYV